MRTPIAPHAPAALFGFLSIALLAVGCDPEGQAPADDDSAPADDDSSGDDDAAPGDDDSAPPDDDSAPPDDDTADDDVGKPEDDTSDDDDDPPVDACDGVTFTEGAPENWETVHAGMAISPAEAYARVATGWAGDVIYESGSGDTLFKIDVTEGSGWWVRAPVDDCPAAYRIGVTLTLYTPTCTFAESHAAELTFEAGSESWASTSWSEPAATSANEYDHGVDPTEWDELIYGYELSFIGLGTELASVSGLINLQGSRDLGGGMGEGFYNFLANLSGSATDPGIPEGWEDCFGAFPAAK